MKYAPKNTTVDAIQWTGDIQSLIDFIRDHATVPPSMTYHYSTDVVEISGVGKLSPSDYLIRKQGGLAISRKTDFEEYYMPCSGPAKLLINRQDVIMGCSGGGWTASSGGIWL